ncbi:hypothetical protein ACWC6I_44620 [Streptomyces sp. NPDC001414]
MAHHPFPNRDRARRQVDRHNATVTPWAQARTRTDAPPPALRLVDDFATDDYRLSTRRPVVPAG